MEEGPVRVRRDEWFNYLWVSVLTRKRKRFFVSTLKSFTEGRPMLKNFVVINDPTKTPTRRVKM